MHLRPIPTTYAGVTFRSRLEARWAVFFDKLGVRWLYEPEGFELPSGAKYLPDFYLRELSAWIEVKPRDCWAEDRRLAEFAGQLSGNWYKPHDGGNLLFLLCPEPPTDEYDWHSNMGTLNFLDRLTNACLGESDSSGWAPSTAEVLEAARAANAHRFW